MPLVRPGSSLPSTWKVSRAPPPRNGGSVWTARCRTPGRVPTESSKSRRNTARRSGSAYRLESSKSPISTLRGFRPRSVSCNRTKLLSSRPAPMSRMTVSAVSQVTRERWRRFSFRPPAAPRLPSFRESSRRDLHAMNADGSPQRTADSRGVKTASASRAQSNWTGGSANRWERDVASSLLPQNAMAVPKKAASMASTELSVRSWRMSLHTPAPSALRTASSRRRAMPLASTRFPTLAHPINRTKVAAPISTNRGVRTSPTATC